MSPVFGPSPFEFQSELFERLFQASPAAISIVSLDTGLYVAVNAAFEAMVGYERAELIGRSPVDLEIWEANLRATIVDRLVQSGALRDYEVTLRTRDGEARLVMSSFELIAFGGQRLMVALINDVTDRRRAEGDLDLVFALSPELICVAGRDGYFKRVNPAFNRVLGYAESELLSVPFADFVHPEDRESTAVELSRLAGGDLSIDFENRYRRKDGSYVWLRWTSVPSATGDRIFAVARNITKQRDSVDALQAAHREAERANVAKSEFLSRMSHELRTPLNVILGFAQLLQLEQLEADQQESVEHILKAGRHLLNLVDEVLNLSRIEAGRLALSLEPISVAAVVDDAAAMMRPLAAQRHVVLQVQPVDVDVHVFADRQRLKQVVLNLLSNGIKYNHEGGTVIVRSEADADQVRLSFIDSGSGIPAEKLERLFSPFDRLGAEATVVEGTGLGLTLSKHLVEAMSGTIEVRTEPGHGSTFAVLLPRAEPFAELTEEHALPPVSTAALSSEMLVLYIEDNLANISVVEKALRRRPRLKLMPAMQGSIGLELARQHRPDLVLLDLHLPDMHGADVLDALQLHKETSQIPVVVASADGTTGQAQRLLEAGAYAYLTKPIDIAEFLSLIDELLG